MIDIDKIESSLSKIKLIGVLISKKIRSTPRGKYAFLQISDLKGIIDLAIFDEALLYNSNELLVEGNSLYFSVEVRKDNAGVRIIAESVEDIDQAILRSGINVKVVINSIEQLECLKEKVNYTSGIKIQLSAKLETGDIVYFKQKKIFINLNELPYLQKIGIANL